MQVSDFKRSENTSFARSRECPSTRVRREARGNCIDPLLVKRACDFRALKVKCPV